MDLKKLEETNREFAENPKAGHFWSEHFGLVCLVLEMNDYAVLIADKRIEMGKDHYSIDYQHLTVLSRKDFIEAVKFADLLHPDEYHLKDYQEGLKEGIISPTTLPHTQEEADLYFTQLKQDKERELFKARTPLVGYALMTKMDNPKEGYHGYFIKMADGTYIDVQLDQDNTYSFFIRDKEGQEGFREHVKLS